MQNVEGSTFPKGTPSPFEICHCRDFPFY